MPFANVKKEKNIISWLMALTFHQIELKFQEIDLRVPANQKHSKKQDKQDKQKKQISIILQDKTNQLCFSASTIKQQTSE